MTAQMIPDRFPSDGVGSEKKVFNALRNLPSEWRVLHDVAWQSSSSGESGDGQTDFVLLHPTLGLYTFEVKGGDISIDRGQYISTSGGVRHVVKNPFTQARTSKHVLLGYLKERIPHLPYLAMGHGVAFPGSTNIPLLGPEAPPEIIIDRRDLTDMPKAVDRMVQHWGKRCSLDTGTLDEIVELLKPTASVRPLLADDVAEAKARLILLTSDQVKALKQIRRNRRALTYGGAGTGKTILAVERARQLEADGFRVLLTCFNRPLADHLGRVLADTSVEVASFHQLCWNMASKAGFPVPADPDTGWFDEQGPSMLPDAAGISGFEVDAVVVDEGQDFAPEWWTALKLLLADPDEGPMYVFADYHQAIYRSGWEPPFDGFIYELFTNCRNTLPIAEVVAGLFGDEVDSLGAGGPDPEYVEIDDIDDAPETVRRTLVRLMKDEGIGPDQIAVLAGSRQLVGKLRRLKVMNRSVLPVDDASPVMQKLVPHITGESFYRFKGLERDVVVAVLHDPPRNPQAISEWLSLAYVGLSRARTHLIVIATRRAMDRLLATTVRSR